VKPILPTDKKPGVCMLIYGNFGHGKTYSVTTLPGQTAYIKTEPRDHTLVVGTPDNVHPFTPDGFDDLMETFNQWLPLAEKNELPYANVFFDSASFFMTQMKMLYEDDRETARIRDRKTVGDLLTDRFHLVDSDVGGIASLMTRLVAAMNRLSMYNVNIIWTATQTENPKWNMALSAAPAFLYRQFPMILNGFFDFIGLIITPWKLKEDGTVTPPVISFVSEDDSYVSKCCSSALARKNPAPLDFSRIFRVIKGQ
jgi:hypothetical protein